MNEQFVTVFIEKMRNVITEFQSKIILLETDLHFKDLKIEELSKEIEILNKNSKKLVKKEQQQDTF